MTCELPVEVNKWIKREDVPFRMQGELHECLLLLKHYDAKNDCFTYSVSSEVRDFVPSEPHEPATNTRIVAIMLFDPDKLVKELFPDA